MSRLLAAVGLGLAFAMAIGPASADDGWNPFKDEPRKTERAARQRSPGDRPPPLAPMGGVTSKPWLETDSQTERGPNGPAEPWSNSGGSAHQSSPGASTIESVQRTELQPLPPIAGQPPEGPSTPAPVGPPPAGAPGWPARPETRQPPPPHASDVPPGWTTRAETRPPSLSAHAFDGAKIAEIVPSLSLPPRSAALAHLWHQLLSSEPGPASDDRSSRPGRKPGRSPDAWRMDALYRSGFVTELRQLMSARPPTTDDPVQVLMSARAQIVLGDREPGCSAVKGVQGAQSSLPKSVRQDFLLLAALCGVGDGDASKARIAADLLRSENVSDPLAIASLEALASGNPASFKMPSVKTVSPLDYRFLELVDAEPMLDGAEPALLAIAATTAKNPAHRIVAAEAALSVHAIHSADLATAYQSARFSPSALAQPFAEDQPPPLQRALLFQALEAEAAPIKRARFARALLDEVRRTDGPYQQVAALLAPALASLRPTPELGWFTETAIEIALAGGRTDVVSAWSSASAGSRGGRFDDWLALADIAAADWRGRRGEHLHAVERRGVAGELAPELMHRLVTVLDALDYQIPIPLWEAASKTQQPASGFLPATGVLSELQAAAQQRDQAGVVLLAMRTLGPDSGATAHMIALGDTIRALKRVGLEAEARQLGLEALYMAWPRRRAD